MKRIHIHWTAGAYTPSSLDLKHYHFVVAGDGTIVAGVPVERNAGTLKSGYAAHTLNANTDAVGVAMACMGNAVERPFDAGRWPMLYDQFDACMKLVAKLCDRYNISVTSKTVLTHAEVQPNLGIRQRGKWDITRLPFKPELVGHASVGDYIRDRVSHYLGANTEEGTVSEPLPADTRGVVATNGGGLNVRSGPGLQHTRIGSVADGTTVEIVAISNNWMHVSDDERGLDGWVHSDWINVAPAEMPTTPDPTREIIARIRADLNKLEEML